ncbi:MAG: Phenylacetic acid catabolic protein [Anaerolineae bacterium]
MSTMSDATLSVQHVEDLDAATADALLRWGLALADTKHRIGMRTSEWVNGTPALEAAVGASALTQDELGHARSYFSMLRQFPGAPEAIGFENDLAARDVYYNPRVLNTPWASWLDVIAVNVLLDRALHIAVAATSTSTYAPLRQRAAKVVQEEDYHRIFGDSWLARLAAREDALPQRLQDSLNRFWGTAVAWFGPPDDAISDDAISARLYDAGILNATPAQMRARWEDQVTALLSKNNLTPPDMKPDWSNWHPAHRDTA